jgi:carbonic anhydrase
MKKNLFFVLNIILLISFILTQDNDYEKYWLSFPACHMGRLQSPVRLNISESTYSNSFSIVYQQFSEITFQEGISTQSNIALTRQPSIKLEPNVKNSSNYINLQRNGVIKQYSFERIEIFRGLHKIESSKSQYEVHLIFKKELGFSTNQNQYRRIVDTNNYLSIVLRYNYSAPLSDNISPAISDSGFMKQLFQNNNVNLNDFPIFQDKRAFFYEGSQIYNPCSEDYNYIVLYDTFYSDVFSKNTINDPQWAKRDFAYSYDRPIYRNFMNYTETINGRYIKINMFMIIGLLSIIFL